MNRLLQWVRRLIRELRRRRVIRVAALYAGTAFVVLQLGEILVEPFGLGDWTLRLITLLLVLGFPLALGLAWVYNITEEGVVRDAGEEAALDGATGDSPFTSNGLIAGLLIVAIGLFLYPRIFSSEQPTSAGEPATPDTAQIEDRSIAVLPFEALSPGQKSKTFARGIHGDLLTRLSNVSDLKVISRTSVQKYRDTDLSLPAIADSLGVRWVMEGGVEVLGGQIQVNAQLIDPRRDAHVWAEDYRRKLTAENLFAIQTEITRKIAGALKAQLTAGEKKRISGVPTQDLKAYRLYVKGRRLLAKRGPQALQKAVKAFRRALKRDSTYALAWAGLADALALGRWYAVEFPASVPTAEGAARRALKLGPNLGEAHASMGFVHFLDQDGPAALRALRRAVELKPSYAQAQHWLGAFQLIFGRLEPALRHLALAVKLSPHHKTAREWLASAYLADGKAKAAVREARQARRNTPNEMPPIALLHLGRFEEAREVARRAVATPMGSGWEDPYQRAALAVASVAVGDSAEARRQLAKLGTEKAELFARGVIHAALGKREAAFEAFKSVDHWGATSAYSVMTLRYYYPEVLGPLRKDPRYEALIEEINRAWGLGPDGTIPETTEASTGPKTDA